jgi:hypothetical protein
VESGAPVEPTHKEVKDEASLKLPLDALLKNRAGSHGDTTLLFQGRRKQLSCSGSSLYLDVSESSPKFLRKAS